MKKHFHLWCTVIAAVSLVPYAADATDADLPVWLRWSLLLLSEALHYMAVFFHEPGHALAHWLFGEPALPLLDPQKGGGMTYSIGRSIALLIFVYVVMFSALVLLLRKGRRKAAAGLACFILLHALLVLTGWDRFVSTVMGHGAEVMAASVLLALGWNREDILKTTANRAVALVAGFHFYGRNILLCEALLFSAPKRQEHAMQKGIPGLGDYQHAADVSGLPVETVAAGMVAFMAACAAVTVCYIVRWQKKGPA